MGNDPGKCTESGCRCRSFDAKENVAAEGVKGGLLGGVLGAGSFALGIELELLQLQLQEVQQHHWF